MKHLKLKIFLAHEPNEVSICDEDENIFICSFGRDSIDDERKMANARRIVACWNACKDFETVDLEDKTLEELTGADSEAVKVVQLIERMKSERQNTVRFLKVLETALVSNQLDSGASMKIFRTKLTNVIDMLVASGVTDE